MRPWPVLGLVLILGPLMVNGSGRLTVLPAGSGRACASNPPQKCVQGATCTSGGCQCSEGDGRFVCYNAGVQRIEIKDNVLKSWNHQLTTIIFPCRLRLTAFKTKGAGDVSSCFTQVFSLHQVVGGRTTLMGVEVFFHVTLNSGEVRKIGYRITGTLADGSYSFDEMGTVPEEIEQPVNQTNNFIHQDMDGSGSGDGEGVISDDEEGFDEDDDIIWGYPEMLVLPHEATISSFIDMDNFGVIQALPCGVTVKFRPSSGNILDNSEVSGLSVAVDEGSGANDVSFTNPHTYVAGPPQTIFSQAMTPEQILVELALEYQAHQDGPAEAVCLASGYVYHKVCNSEEARDDAVKNCSAFLDANMVYCLHINSGPSAINLFKECMQYYCKRNFATCSSLQSSWAPVTNCHSYLPSLLSQLQCDVYING